MGSINPAWLQRLRHKRGFGVHSPFAFRFITEVLNPPRGYRYYCEQDCPSADIRIVERLRANFCPKNEIYAGKRAVKISGRTDNDGLDFENADFIVIDLQTIDRNDELVRRIERGNDLVVLAFNHNRRRLAPLLKAMPSGMCFRNARSKAVLVINHKLPRQDFWVKW